MPEPVPTLSSAGFVTGIQEKADRLFAYFLVSQYSQTYSHAGQISSFPKILQEQANDPSGLNTAVRQALIDLYQGYFDSVEVDVDTVPFPDNDSKLNIKISVILTQDGTSHSLSRLVSTQDSVVSKVVKLQTI